MKRFFNEVVNRYFEGEDIKSFPSVFGGSINRCFRLHGSKSYFIKLNDNAPADFFLREAQGLSILNDSKAVSVPKTYGCGIHKGKYFLLLENVDSAPYHRKFWQVLGTRLAQLHKITAPQHGLDHNNYIGVLPQENDFKESWIDFFVSQRLMPQINLANQSNLLSKDDNSKLNKLVEKLDKILPDVQPSLIHGDLWHGNVISDSSGMPLLVDPAVCYTNREMEIAFTMLFGGFDKEFYDSYKSEYALEKDFNERIDIYNLYPLLVHLNLFGKSYLAQIIKTVKNFI